MSDLENPVACGHCYNISKMEIIGNGYVTETEDVDENYSFEYGDTYQIVKCPACNKINFVSFSWHEHWPEARPNYIVLYPQNGAEPVGLPDHILKAYRAAEKVRTVYISAYAILLRRILEEVCLNRQAQGSNLAAMLKDLASKQEIPEKLVNVAKGLRELGNIGAHAGEGELGEDEVPILKALCDAILEYIYSAPHLAELAESKLNKIKRKNRNDS